MVIEVSLSEESERRIFYNSEDGHYEVKDEKGELITKIIKDDGCYYNINKNKRFNYYPYQEGWPVKTPSSIYRPLTIGDLTGDEFKEIFALTYWHGRYIYDYLGNIICQPNARAIPAFKDFDFDGINEIIGGSGGTPTCNAFCGATVLKWNGIELNGFPNPPNTGFVAATVEDIDRDGNYEIAFAASGPSGFDNYNLGMNVLGSWGGFLPGFPVFFPPFSYDMPATGNCYASPSVGDFDNDGIMELSVFKGEGRFYIVKSDGSFLRNWPIWIDSSHTSAVSLGDIDNDNELELVMPGANTPILYVFNSDATFAKGFPVPYGISDVCQDGISLADINKDGKLEMYLLLLCSSLTAFDNEGNILPGWPIELRVDGYSVSFNHSATIADIDGDGEMEIIAAGGTCEWCPDGVLVAYNYDGSLVEGFPIIENYYGFIDVGPTVADLDNDGDIEICTGSEYCFKSEHYAYIFCYDLPYPYNEEKIAWNNYARDNQHTSRYVNPEIKPPVVYSVNPNSSAYRGGRLVEIKGKNFLPGAKVFFDGIPSDYVQVVDSETIFAKVPPHRPCRMYINDLSISPYEISEKLINQPTANNSKSNLQNFLHKSQTSDYDIENLNACIVNVVVVHPNPDQREGILRAGFTYTGYDVIEDNITLYVSKYATNGKFENNGANWAMYHERGGLWNPIDDQSNCIKRPYPSGHKALYYGDKSKCNYNTGERTYGELRAPYITVDSPNAKIRFKYYRDVEHNPLRNADEFTVIMHCKNSWETIWLKDSTEPSEKAWVQSPELDIGKWVGEDEVRIIFIFDSKDGIDNDHAGIAIDDVELIGAHWTPWDETSGEVILNWTGGLPKYFVYRNTSPDFVNHPPKLRAYTPFNHKHENTLNDDKSYYYKVR